MGALLVAEGNSEKGAKEVIVDKICASDSVVYQLVRVEGDGRLVPATDDELMEVEHLLEDDKSKSHPVEAKTPFPPSKVLTPKMSGSEASEGPLKSENLGVDPQALSSRHEHIEVTLQKDKQEERLQLKCEVMRHLPEHMIVDVDSSDNLKHSQDCGNKVQPESTSVTTASETCLNGCRGVQSGCEQTCSESANGTVSGRSSAFGSCSSKPDFSVLKGEVCLDNLTIRELQEVFLATFGRVTNVKDKLWLKRRIAMGLTNSCNVPTSSFVIKDNMIVPKEVKEEPCRVQRNMSRTVFVPTDQVNNSTKNKFQDSAKRPRNQIEDKKALSARRLWKSVLEYNTNENHQTGQCAAKRIRKPTRRYIEHLSEVEVVEYSGRLISSVKNPGDGHPSPKSHIRAVRDIISKGNVATRQDSLGGSGIQIPYVSRVRRSRPRKNLFALTYFQNFVGVEVDRKHTETSNSEDERNPEHEKLDHAGDNSDSNADLSTMKIGPRRKHHRAWTLCEVLKLVEGVARYGAGRWSEIRRVAFASYPHRTSVDLKDKWRNLLKSSFAQEPPENGARNSRKHTSMPIPTPILSRVRELAMMHSQSGIEYRPSKFAGHDMKFVQKKEPGFL